MRQSIANWQHRWGRMSSIAWVLAGQALQSLTSFLTVAAVGRWAGASELGIFALAVSCFFLAASVIDTLVATPYTYLHAHTDSPAQADLGLAALAAAMLVGVLVALPLTVLWWLDWTALAKLWPLLPHDAEPSYDIYLIARDAPQRDTATQLFMDEVMRRIRAIPRA